MLGGMIASTHGLLTGLSGHLSHLIGWSTAATYFLLLLGYGYFLVALRRGPSDRARRAAGLHSSCPWPVFESGHTRKTWGGAVPR